MAVASRVFAFVVGVLICLGNCVHSSHKTDRCQPNPCKNHGTCYITPTQSGGLGLKCNCHVAYRGSYCQEKTPVCSALKCGNMKACFAAPTGTLCLCEGIPPSKYQSCLADKPLSDIAHFEAVRTGTGTMANTANIIIILASILVVLAIGFALLYRQASTKLHELDLMYLDAEHKGYTPVSRLPTLSEAISDVIKTTFCCAQSVFPSSYRRPDDSSSFYPPNASRNCNAVEQNMWPAPYMDSNRSFLKTQSFTRENNSKKWTRNANLYITCHNPNAQRKYKRNVYKKRNENACNTYSKGNACKRTKQEKRKRKKKYSVNVNMNNESGLSYGGVADRGVADSYWCQNMPFLKYCNSPNMNKKYFNRGRQELGEENITRHVPYQQMTYKEYKETLPSKDQLKRAIYEDERHNFARCSGDNTGRCDLRQEKTPIATLRDTHNQGLLKVDATGRKARDNATQLGGGIWVTTIIVPDERGEEKEKLVIDFTGDDDFMNGVPYSEDDDEQSPEAEDYADQSLEAEDYAEQSIEAWNYAEQSLEAGDYAERSPEAGDYAEQSLETGNYAEQSLEAGDYAEQSLGARDYAEQSLGAGDYDKQSLGAGNYAEQSLEGGNYAEQSLKAGDYAEQSPEAGDYAEQSSEAGNYAEQSLEASDYAKQSPETGDYAEQSLEAGNYAEQSLEAGDYAKQSPETGDYAEQSLEAGNYAEQSPEAGNYAEQSLKAVDYAEQSLEAGDYAEQSPETGDYAEQSLKAVDYAEQSLEAGDYAEQSLKAEDYAELALEAMSEKIDQYAVDIDRNSGKIGNIRDHSMPNNLNENDVNNTVHTTSGNSSQYDFDFLVLKDDFLVMKEVPFKEEMDDPYSDSLREQVNERRSAQSNYPRGTDNVTNTSSVTSTSTLVTDGSSINGNTLEEAHVPETE